MTTIKAQLDENKKELAQINTYFPIKMKIMYIEEQKRTDTSKYNMDRWYSMDRWHVKLINPNTGKEMSMDYYTKLDLRWYPQGEQYKRLYNDRLWNQETLEEESGKPVAPSILDVLYRIHIEDVTGISFKNFCFNFGYDMDSPKALDMYLTCQKQTDEFRQIFPDVNLHDIDIITER
jgi:hypothetical protein